MDTSGSSAVAAVLLWVVAGLAGVAAQRLPVRTRRPAVALALCLVVAVPSVLGLLVPAVYEAAFRDPALVRDGQWWRLATAIVVQDGGWPGLASNLALLGFVGFVAGRVRGPGWIWAVFVTCGVAFNAVALAWGPGAGNSAATLALAAAVVATALRQLRDVRSVVVAAATVAVAVALVTLRDGHGVAVLLGLAVGAVGAVGAVPTGLVGRAGAGSGPGGRAPGPAAR
ncbi:rhomboid family intramembrane serine protease [Pseudonocardia sp.]|uniref:rhomboid family intramembrane serine protease n=1 Tax=Pseudonocardia sp. TaxID=60912 RepID=UPI003D0A7E74